MRMLKKNLFSTIFFFFFVFLDQASKYIVRQTGGFYVCNPNISFGIALSPAIFWTLWTGIILTILYLFLNPKGQPIKFTAAGYLLILAGAFSNIIDRLALGCVADFIDLKFWPVFNLADVFVSAGVIMLLLNYLKKENKI
jgi:signal peptidase II